jgi:uncharacterized protein (TIGR02271 family)
MTDTMSYQRWIGRTLVDCDGSKIGRVDQIYVDERSGRPAWMTVHTGLFGTRTSFVPLQDTSPAGADLAVPYSKDQVKNAPSIEPDGRLDPREEQALYRHYSVASDTGPDGTTDAAMTRSEEELRVGKESVESGRARLRKYVETEDVQMTVPVTHEEARVEREPITDADRRAATRGPQISDDEREVVLHEERPVVAKEVVPKERVRLNTEVATEEYPVAEEIRKERIEAENLDSRRRP